MPRKPWRLRRVTARSSAAGALRADGLAHLLPPDLPDERVVQNAGSIAPLHRACARASSVRCPHLSVDPSLNLARFAERWHVVPLWVEGRLTGAEPGDSPGPEASFQIVAFLQLIGVTRHIDRAWR